MENFFNNVFKFIAVLCAILFVLTVGIALVLFNAERRLFNADLYTAALESQNFYENLPALAAETLSTAPQEDGDLSAVRSLLAMVPAENWEAALRALLPAEVSKPMSEQAIASAFDYLNGKSETATLSLADFKAHMSSPASTQAFVDILRAQPPCTLEQMAEMTFNALTGNPKLIFCNPSEEALGLMQPLIQSGLQTAAAGIPDSVTLIQPDAEKLQEPLRVLRTLRGVLRFSPLIPLGLLFLVTLFAVRDAKSWLLWWGVPLLLGGLLGLLLAALIGPLTNWAFLTYAAPRFPDMMTFSVRELVRDLVTTVLSGIARPIALESLALVLIGILMLIVTRYKKITARTA
jgi:hypothetical protein